MPVSDNECAIFFKTDYDGLVGIGVISYLNDMPLIDTYSSWMMEFDSKNLERGLIWYQTVNRVLTHAMALGVYIISARHIYQH